MTEITLSSDITVNLIDHMGSDDSIIRAAQVSVKGENNADMPDQKRAGLINYLMKSRHGSPFEHNAMTFYVEAPIFVFREWHRHRISSINEMSGRYTVLKPKFYTPNAERNLVNVGSSARPEFAPGDEFQQRLVRNGDEMIAQLAWDAYEQRIDAGVANEIARTVLPVSVYSQMYWTANLRSIFNFLSLRVDSEDSTYRSRPQREIEMGAQKIEAHVAEIFPLAYESFIKAGRVAP